MKSNVILEDETAYHPRARESHRRSGRHGENPCSKVRRVRGDVGGRNRLFGQIAEAGAISVGSRARKVWSNRGGKTRDGHEFDYPCGGRYRDGCGGSPIVIGSNGRRHRQQAARTPPTAYDECVQAFGDNENLDVKFAVSTADTVEEAAANAVVVAAAAPVVAVAVALGADEKGAERACFEVKVLKPVVEGFSLIPETFRYQFQLSRFKARSSHGSFN